MALKFFVDFDGTITRDDVGNAFFSRFGGEQCNKLVGDYKEGRISAADCFRGETAAVGALKKIDLDRFIRSHPIDVSFKEFVSFCRAGNIEFHVVSDGLDYYIREIFASNDIRDISYFANKVQLLSEDGGETCKVDIQFPYSDAECTRCACCKRNIMLTHAGDEDIIAYVGEGYSDLCPAQYADIVFAKEDLQKFCQLQNISYYPYNTFHDIVWRMEKLLVSRKVLRKRRRAELMRRAVFMRE
jgi:2-hydroxy-3-keto-5-methylthiopentenyl-1-phosphate phosphatase